jgi:hypothetical protein
MTAITSGDAIQAALENKTYDIGLTADAGTLTGAEQFPVSRGTGNKFQTTLAKIASFIINEINTSNSGVLLTDTGVANAYSAVNPSPLTTATWKTGVVEMILVGHTNTGASTYAPDGLPAIPILGDGFLPLTGGEMLAGGVAWLMKLTITGINSGNPFCVLLDCTGAPQQIPSGVAAAHSANVGQVQSASASVGIDTGAANAYVVAFSPALANPVPWAPFWIKVKTTNTGASTLNATGSVQPLVGAAHIALQGGEMVAGGNALVYWNPTLNAGAGSFVLMFCTGASEQIAPGTASSHAAQIQQIGHGQCRLVATSGTQLQLNGFNGNNIIINGVPQQIPNAGIVLANTGLQGQVVGASYSITSNVCTYVTSTAHGLVVGARVNIRTSNLATLCGNFIVTGVTNSTTFTFAVTNANVSSTTESASSIVVPIYYVYVAMVSGTMTLLADQIGYTVQLNGIATKSTDTTKTLVGMFVLNSSGQFQSGPTGQLVLNWFNRRLLSSTTIYTAHGTFTNTTAAETSATARCPLLQWADDEPNLQFNGIVTASAAAAVSVQLVVDAIALPQYTTGETQAIAGAGSSSGTSQSGSITSANEGFHQTLVCPWTASGTGTLYSCQTTAICFG